MARYDWPDAGENPDQLNLRNEHNFLQSAFTAPETIEEAIAARAQILTTSTATDDELWLPIGPSTMIKGQATGNPNVAGRVRDLKVNSSGDRAYAASANGGVWYTNDAGESWHPLGSWGLDPDLTTADDVHSLTIGALDVRFGQNDDKTDNPDLDVVYAATGELRPFTVARPAGKHGGVGVLRLNGTVTEALERTGGVPWKREGRRMIGAGIYRLTHDPEDELSFDPTDCNVMVAATSTGLYSRHGPFFENADWVRFETTTPPFDFSPNSGIACTDVVWTPALLTSPAVPSRLWVAITERWATSGSRTDVYVADTVNGVFGQFQRIELPGRRSNGRIGLAAAPSDPNVVYALGTLSNEHAQLWRIEPKSSGSGFDAHTVKNTPVGLFGKPEKDGSDIIIKEDQSGYDLAITVDPDDKNIVFVGGKSAEPGGRKNAALFKLTITEPSSGNYQTNFLTANQLAPGGDTATYYGLGAHADVHALTIGPNGLWIGCDGGVFRRDGGATQARALNTGLAVAEPGFVAAHPDLDGPCIAGTQDNGLIERVGDTLWQLWRGGDGGGVAYHMTKPAHYIGQYVRASWHVKAGRFTAPVFRSNKENASTKPEISENDNANFYSGVAVVPGVGDKCRVAIGTNRVWYSDDWDPGATGAMRWVTLPTGTDPAGDDSRLSQDIVNPYNSKHNIIALKWAAAGDASNDFHGSKLLVVSRSKILQYKLDVIGGTKTWSRKDFTAEKEKLVIDSNQFIPTGPSDRLPLLGRWTDIASHDSGRGAHGSFYISATGHSQKLESGAIEEADRMDTLWWFDGTATFHQTGLRNAPLDPSNGTAGSKAPAYAVLCDPDEPETVYVGNAMGVWKGTLSFSGATPSWEWRGLLNGLPQAVVQDLTFHKSGDLKLLRAALQSRGIWELDISDTPKSVGRTFLRKYSLDMGRAEIAPDLIEPVDSDPVRPGIQQARLEMDKSPDIYVHNPFLSLPWPSGQLPSEPEMMIATSFTRPIFSRQNIDVYVLVHHRHTTVANDFEARVLLLQFDNAPADLSDISLDESWARAVMAVFDGTSTTLPTGWKIADGTGPDGHILSPGGKLDARTPRAVRFTGDITHDFNDGITEDSVLFLALVTSTTDPIEDVDLTGPTGVRIENLDQLLRRSSHVAARRVQRES